MRGSKYEHLGNAIGHNIDDTLVIYPSHQLHNENRKHIGLLLLV